MDAVFALVEMEGDMDAKYEVPVPWARSANGELVVEAEAETEADVEATDRVESEDFDLRERVKPADGFRAEGPSR